MPTKPEACPVPELSESSGNGQICFWYGNLDTADPKWDFHLTAIKKSASTVKPIKEGKHLTCS